MLIYFLIGAGLGILTGIPIGPVNVAVIDASYRHHLRRALVVGMGGAIGDMVYALLGIVGIGPYLNSRPAIKPFLFVISGVLLLAYGFITARAKPADAQVKAKVKGDAPYFWNGFGLGFALIFLNPGTLITWVFIVGTHFAESTQTEGTVAAIGIGFGSACWFSFVAWVTDRSKNFLGEKIVWITRVIGVGLMIYGAFLVGREIWVWLL